MTLDRLPACWYGGEMHLALLLGDSQGAHMTRVVWNPLHSRICIVPGVLTDKLTGPGGAVHALPATSLLMMTDTDI